jgi:tripartite-type tricarboxylate transporter receptor subunit TctC
MSQRDRLLSVLDLNMPVFVWLGTRNREETRTMKRRDFLTGAVACGVSAAAFRPARAQHYPDRPVKVVVTFPAGGPLDFVTRAVTDKMSAKLKQPFLVENRSGAAGNIGTAVGAKAAPDGYTLLVTLNTTLTVNPRLYKDMTFDPIKDLQPISVMVANSQMLVVHPSVPVKSVAEFVAYAKKTPITYAHAGFGSPGHLAMEYFRLKAGFQAVAVPYKGNAPLVTDLLGGQVQSGFVASAGVLPHVHSGKLRGLATSAAQRSPLAPNIPTIAESGYPGFKVETMFILLAPAGLPKDIAALLEREARAGATAPDLQDKFHKLDLRTIGSTAAEAEADIAADAKLWAGVIEAAHMRIQ